MAPSSRHPMETGEHFQPNGAANGKEKKRLAIAYAIWVGAPLLGLIVILKVGGDTRAPIAVGGVWDVQTDARTLGLGKCHPLAVPGEVSMTISQSGRNLEITLDGSGGTGSIEGLRVNAFVQVGDDSCHERQGGIYLQGDVEGSPGSGQMTGVIGLSGCTDCVEVSFRAIRRPPSPKVGP